MKIGYVYLFTMPNKKCYVGQTWDIKKRMNSYKSESSKNNPRYLINDAHKKYGFENCKCEIIFEGPITQQGLNDIEDWAMSRFDTKTPDQGGCGYNIKEAGSRGKHSEATKIKLSEMKKGEKCHFYGKKHTDETKAKMSESAIGRKMKDSTKQKLSELWKGSKSPNFGKTTAVARSVICEITNEKWVSARKCAEELKIPTSTLSRHLTGNQPVKKFAHLRYLD